MIKSRNKAYFFHFWIGDSYGKFVISMNSSKMCFSMLPKATKQGISTILSATVYLVISQISTLILYQIGFKSYLRPTSVSIPNLISDQNKVKLGEVGLTSEPLPIWVRKLRSPSEVIYTIWYKIVFWSFVFSWMILSLLHFVAIALCPICVLSQLHFGVAFCGCCILSLLHFVWIPIFFTGF